MSVVWQGELENRCTIYHHDAGLPSTKALLNWTFREVDITKATTAFFLLVQSWESVYETFIDNQLSSQNIIWVLFRKIRCLKRIKSFFTRTLLVQKEESPGTCFSTPDRACVCDMVFVLVCMIVCEGWMILPF